MNFQIKGLEKLIKKCQKLEKEQKGIILKEIFAETLLKETKENFEKEQDSFGNQWKNLSEKTLKARSYAKPKITHSKKLFATGTLSSSLATKIENNTAFVGVNASSNGYQYGMSHQFGTKKIPARPFFPFDKDLNLNPRVARKIEEETASMLLTLFKKELK